MSAITCGQFDHGGFFSGVKSPWPTVSMKRPEKAHDSGKKLFAVAGTTRQDNNNAAAINWLSVSRNEMAVWIRELPPMTSPAPLSEDIIVQSAQIRLTQFRVTTRCAHIPVLRNRLMQGLRDYHVVASSRENQFCVALEEALNNAFYHGNLELDSAMKEDGSSRFMDLAMEREQLSPWSMRIVLVTELVSVFGIWVTIQDEGRGFDVQSVLDRCNDPEAALLASGRGLLLMRAFTDELFFNARGNEVTLVLYGDGPNRELPLGTQNCCDTKKLVLA